MTLRLVADNPHVPRRRRYYLDRDPVAMALVLIENAERETGAPCPDDVIATLALAISPEEAREAVLEALYIRARDQSGPDDAA